MANKPDLLKWVPTDDAAKIVDPGTAKKTNGFLYLEKPAFQYVNYIFNRLSKWIRGLQGSFADIVIGSSAQVTSYEATHTINQLNDTLVLTGSRILFLSGTHTLTGNISLSASNLILEMENSSAVIDMASLYKLTLSGNRIKGNLIFSNVPSASDAISVSGVSSQVILHDVDVTRVTSNNASQVQCIGTVCAIKMNGSLIGTEKIDNALINGEFDIWQAGIIFTAAGYWADCWRGQIGVAATISRQSFALGQTDVPGEPRYFLRHNRTSASAAENTVIEQRIESVRGFAGRGVRIRFRAKTGAARTLHVDLLQHFGTGGTPSADVAIAPQAINLTTSWQLFDLTFVVPSISGKALGTDLNDYLSFRVRENGSFGTFIFDIAEAHLADSEFGATVKRRNKAENLSLCERYFCKSYDPDVEPGEITTIGYSTMRTLVVGQTAVHGMMNIFHVRMRSIPTVTWYSPDTGAAGKVRNGSTNLDVTASSGDGISTRQTGNPVMSVAQSVGDLIRGHWTASARL